MINIYKHSYFYIIFSNNRHKIYDYILHFITNFASTSHDSSKIVYFIQLLSLILTIISFYILNIEINS